MRQKHWRVWDCSLGCSASFQSSDGLRSHVLQEHMAEVSTEDVDTLVFLSSKPDLTRAEGTCPLCLSCDIRSSRMYMSHVGNHLEQLSLFVLPRDQDDGEQESPMEDGSSYGQGSQVSEAGSEALPSGVELEGPGEKRGPGLMYDPAMWLLTRSGSESATSTNRASVDDAGTYNTPEEWLTEQANALPDLLSPIDLSGMGNQFHEIRCKDCGWAPLEGSLPERRSAKSRAEALQKHIRRKHQTVDYQCVFCGILIQSSFDDMEDHTRRFHPEVLTTGSRVDTSQDTLK